MFKTNFLLAFRHLTRNRIFSLINILGLAVSMASCLLILTYVQFESSYDEFWSDSADLYRVQVDYYREGQTKHRFAVAYPSTGKWFKDNFPEVETYARLNGLSASGIISYVNVLGKKIKYNQDQIFYASQSTLEIFKVDIIDGDRNEALVGPGKAVISKSEAEKYFLNENPIGKTIVRNGDEQFIITAVFEDIPENSHIKFDILMSYDSFIASRGASADESWGWWDFYTYLKLKKGTNVENLNVKVREAVIEFMAKDYEAGYRMDLNLQPVTQIHLHSNVGYEHEQNGDISVVNFLMITAGFIILIALINFINLSTTRSLERAREVGVRKVFGSNKGRLIVQFMTESLVVIGISFVIGVTLYQLGKPILESIIGKVLIVDYYSNIQFIGILIAILLSTSLLAGFYPAFVLSSYRPLAVISGRVKNSSKGVNLRKTLVVIQFGATAFLIMGTIIVHSQINFMLNQDLGLDIEKTIVIDGPVVKKEDYRQVATKFKNDLQGLSNIENVAYSSDIAGKEIAWANAFSRKSDPDITQRSMRILGVDENYLSMLDIKLLAGRYFNPSDVHKSWYGGIKEDGEGENVALINMAAVKSLGFRTAQDAIGEVITNWKGDQRIIGVVDDFKYRSLQHKPKAVKLVYSPSWSGYYSIKLNPGSYDELSNTISQIKEMYAYNFPDNTFNYFFLDEYFERQYKSEYRFREVFSYFSMFGLLIACLGLVGLSSYSIVQRRREIGIRKVLGAPLKSLLFLLSKEFIKPILISYLLVIPIAYWLMQEWLNNYAYHFEIGIQALTLPLFIIFLAATFTIGYQILKATMNNPTDSLRYE